MGVQIKKDEKTYPWQMRASVKPRQRQPDRPVFSHTSACFWCRRIQKTSASFNDRWGRMISSEQTSSFYCMKRGNGLNHLFSAVSEGPGMQDDAADAVSFFLSDSRKFGATATYWHSDSSGFNVKAECHRFQFYVSGNRSYVGMTWLPGCTLPLLNRVG